MKDEDKTKRQLVDELGELRRRVAALESEAARGGGSPIRCTTKDLPPPVAPTEAERDRDRLQAILTAAIECLPFEFFAIGADGRYIYENALVRERYGDGIGKRPEERAPDEATRRFWLENNRRAMAGERVEGEFERHLGGETRYYYKVVTRIQQGDNFYGILGVNVDVTERKRAEAALQKTHDELERRVAERTAELTAANGQLQHEVEERRRAEEALRQSEGALRKEHRTLELMLHASDHERQLIAYDIHDGLAQQLAGAIMQFQVYDHLKGADPEEAQRAYHGGTTLLRQAHLEARRLISGVRPPVLDESGIVAAVAHLIDDRGHSDGPKVEFHSKVRFRRLAAVLENVIYRIVQEGLSNALRHSQSKQVRVGLLQRGDKIRIEVRDWGIGFDLDTVGGDRFGLAGIRQRARLLGGKCRIESQPGQGTSIVVELPVVEREAV